MRHVHVLGMTPSVFVIFKVVKVRPNDKDAKLKWSECNKIVKKLAFEKAIAFDECKRSAADSINLDNICK